MFYKFLIIVMLLDAFVLMAAVLMQSGKGGGLAASFGGGSAGDALFGPLRTEVRRRAFKSVSSACRHMTFGRRFHASGLV